MLVGLLPACPSQDWPLPAPSLCEHAHWLQQGEFLRHAYELQVLSAVVCMWAICCGWVRPILTVTQLHAS